VDFFSESAQIRRIQEKKRQKDRSTAEEIHMKFTEF